MTMIRISKIVSLFAFLMCNSASQSYAGDMDILHCQSELLKKDKESWSEAVFYDMDYFHIDIKSKDHAQLVSALSLDCTLSVTRIHCTESSKKGNLTVSVNRVTGVYEQYLAVYDKNGKLVTKSKTRGSCAKAANLKF